MKVNKDTKQILRNVIPGWLQSVEYSENPEEMNRIKIVDTETCIVGEAWGFTTKYIAGSTPCDTCSTFGFQFLAYDEDDFMTHLDNFAGHWADKHV